MKKFDKQEQIKLLKIILIIIWMITIFIFSAQQGSESGNTSRGFTVAIIRIITGKSIEADDPFIESMQLLIRKLAHFTIYSIGGFLVMSYSYTTERIKKYKILESITFGGCYAITDEIHQFFVPGRRASIIDVGIDTIGVIVGVIVYIVLRKIIEKAIGNRKI